MWLEGQYCETLGTRANLAASVPIVFRPIEAIRACLRPQESNGGAKRAPHTFSGLPITWC
jgi:hypothetical protein